MRSAGTMTYLWLSRRKLMTMSGRRSRAVVAEIEMRYSIAVSVV